MSSEKPLRRLEDIVENADAIASYLVGIDFATFEKDSKTYDAVERCLERISEAAVKLGDLGPFLMPDQPWQKMPVLRLACEQTIRKYRTDSGRAIG